MYKYFNPIIKLEHSYNMNENYGIYLSFKNVELSALQNLLEFASETSEGKSHMGFIKSYIQTMQQHIEDVKNSKKLLEITSKELLEKLNSVENLEGILSSNECECFLHVGIDTLYFFKPIEYDEYLKSQAYMIFEVIHTKRGYKINQLSIGFTTKSVDELRNEPSFIRKQINKFSNLNNLEEVDSHLKYCKNCLVKFYHVQEYNDLFLPESISPISSISKEILGNPLVIMREIYKSSTAQIIKISLPEELSRNLNDELIELIKNEVNINKKETHKDIMKEHFESYCKSLDDRKSKLMNNLSINQTELDEYIGYLPETFMD